MFQPKPLVTAIALAFSGLAVAQGNVPSTTLDEVVVHDSKLKTLEAGQSVSPQQLDALRPATSDTASLLRDVPGVSLYGAGGVSSLPVIHGLADDRLRIKVDGMDLVASCPNHMNPPLSYVDPTQVEAVKVYAGIAPVSVGGDSIGGSVVVSTKEPVFAQPGQGVLTTGEVGAFYRSNGDARGANVAATVATESFSLTYTGATAKSDNYKAAKDFKSTTATMNGSHTLPLDVVGSSAYETYNHALSMAMRGGNHLFELKLGYQDVPYQMYPNQRMDMLDNEEKRINLRYLGKFDWGSLETRVYHETVDHYMDFGADKRYWYGSNSGAGVPCTPIRYAGDPLGTCAAGMPMNTTSKTTGAEIKASIALDAASTLRVGALAQEYKLDDWWPASGGGMGPNAFDNIKDGKRDRLGVFGELEKQLSPQWLTLIGVRYENVSTDAGMVHGYNSATAPTTLVLPDMMNQNRDAANFNNSDRSKRDGNWDLSALARYTADSNKDIEFGLARKVRSPNLYERYSWSTANMMALMNNFVGDGNGYIGDVNLKPEKAHTLSATLDLHAADRSWEFRATPFYTYVTDYIDAIQWNGGTNVPRSPAQTGSFTILKYTNQTASLYGIDLSGKMPLGRNSFGDFGVKGLLNYTKGENRDTGEGLYNIMPLSVKLALTHRLGNWSNEIEAVGVAGKHDISGTRNEMQTSGYGLLNLRSSYTIKRVRFDIGVDNLFNKFYYLPTGGAYTGQGTTMSITGAPYGTPVPGMGRSLYAGVNVKF